MRCADRAGHPRKQVAAFPAPRTRRGEGETQALPMQAMPLTTPPDGELMCERNRYGPSRLSTSTFFSLYKARNIPSNRDLSLTEPPRCKAMVALFAFENGTANWTATLSRP